MKLSVLFLALLSTTIVNAAPLVPDDEVRSAFVERTETDNALKPRSEHALQQVRKLFDSLKDRNLPCTSTSYNALNFP